MRVHFVGIQSVLISVRNDFINFIQIGRDKINADAGCQVRHFLSSRLVNNGK